MSEVRARRTTALLSFAEKTRALEEADMASTRGALVGKDMV